VKVLGSADELSELDALRGPGPLVLVPTMGALHEGHLELVRHARKLGPAVVSIFVNPTQFGPEEDFAAYPRDLASDLELLEPLGVEAVYAPAVDEMYGDSEGVSIRPGHRARGLCGAGRPGHFSGVLTVVAKLFGLLRPEVAVFGRKDAQQCLVIGQMVADLKMPVKLVDVPTVREDDGLALSSRNRYLNEDQRRRAVCLSRALRRARELLDAGEREAAPLRMAMGQELAEADSLEYAEVRQVPDLQENDRLSGRILLAVAARIGPARLIDNMVLEIAEHGVNDSSFFGAGRET